MAWSARALFKTLARAPRLAPEVLRLSGRAALSGIWGDVELGVLLDSERVRQVLPGTVRGAAWSPDGGFVSALVANLGPTDDVLEIGCGVGRIGRQVAPMVRTLTCTDISRVMVAEAAANLSAHDNVRCLKTRGYWLRELPGSSYDVVYAHAVFVFFDLYPTLAMLDATRRVLRDGGRCVISFMTMDSEEWVSEVVRAARRYDRRGTFGARASRPYTEHQICAMLEATGFELADVVDGTPTATDPNPPTIFVADAARRPASSGWEATAALLEGTSPARRPVRRLMAGR